REAVELGGVPGQLDLDRLHVREAPDDLRARKPAQRTRKLLVRMEADDGAGRRGAARRAGGREDRRGREGCDEEDEQTGDWAGWKAHPGGTESGEGLLFEVGRARRVRYPESRDGVP